jgi:acetyl-CoA carboxylase biotin carboxyl carrier protein
MCRRSRTFVNDPGRARVDVVSGLWSLMNQIMRKMATMSEIQSCARATGQGHRSCSKWTGAGGKRAVAVEVESQITGTVFKIEKAVGDRVEAEEAILILESMKMEIPLEAPCAGVIAEIRTAEGESVEDGDVLVVLS